MTEMVRTLINDRWPLNLPVHRAERHQWPWWEATRLACMFHYLGDGGHVVWDVGAEEGDFPALWSSWGNDTVLIEANERVWPNIKVIWEANDLPLPKGCFVGFAANDNSPTADGYTDRWPPCADGPVIGDHGFANLCERPDIQRRSIDVLATAMAPPTAITIDVEGAELEVLLGAHETLMRHRPLVWVSVHPEFMQRMYRRDPEDLHQYMADCGYERTYLGSDHEEHHWYWPKERELFVQ
jgi:FkbM family methyltransferase